MDEIEEEDKTLGMLMWESFMNFNIEYPIFYFWCCKFEPIEDEI